MLTMNKWNNIYFPSKAECVFFLLAKGGRGRSTPRPLYTVYNSAWSLLPKFLRGPRLKSSQNSANSLKIQPIYMAISSSLPISAIHCIQLFSLKIGPFWVIWRKNRPFCNSGCGTCRSPPPSAIWSNNFFIVWACLQGCTLA